MNGTEFREARDQALFDRAVDNAKYASENIAKALNELGKIRDGTLRSQLRKIIKSVINAAIDKL